MLLPIMDFTNYICSLKFMHQPLDILQVAYKQPLMEGQLEVLQQSERSMPGSVNYSIKRYRKNRSWNMEDTGMLVYHYEKNNDAANYLELKFCITGNM